MFVTSWLGIYSVVQKEFGKWYVYHFIACELNVPSPNKTFAVHEKYGVITHILYQQAKDSVTLPLVHIHRTTYGAVTKD